MAVLDCGIFTLRFSWKVENKWSERINGQRYKLRLKPAHIPFLNENENRDWRFIQKHNGPTNPYCHKYTLAQKNHFN